MLNLVKIEESNFIFNKRGFYWMAGTLSLCALFLSYFVEHFLKIHPCFLCQIQRVPYFFILVFAYLGIIGKNRKFSILIGLCLILNVAFSCYHLLVQAKVLHDFCEIPQVFNSYEDFENLIFASSQACSKVSWKIFGMPLSFFNLFFSLLLLISLKSQKKRINKKMDCHMANIVVK